MTLLAGLSASSFHELLRSPWVVSTKILLRLWRAYMVGLLLPFFLFTEAACSALAAAITLSAWDTDGFVRYLCLKKIVSDTLSACALLTWMMWAR